MIGHEQDSPEAQISLEDQARAGSFFLFTWLVGLLLLSLPPATRELGGFVIGFSIFLWLGLGGMGYARAGSAPETAYSVVAKQLLGQVKIACALAAFTAFRYALGYLFHF